ncbi:hypothetical protein MVEN_00126600 [Mycena venus]|uniref:Uncharacterized protein n=1 Tax=Mycena venus TaxID=2733690 RepID=A0A8H6ZBG6_9AGAR|nr:hypothetical protein MVEN_00126600 [Mycena venus]
MHDGITAHWLLRPSPFSASLTMLQDDPELRSYLNSQNRFHNEQEEREPEQTDELPASDFNEGHGIRYTINFTPQLPPPAPNEKRRANMCAPVVDTSFYVHKKSTLEEVLDAGITAASKKGKPEAKLEIKENPLPVVASTTPDITDEGEKTSRKRKVPPEEEELAETVIQIQQANRCNDRACSSRYCFVGNASAQHVRLTPLHLNIWAAAKVAKMPGIDINTPPPPEEEKMFWPVEQQLGVDGDDIAMLARWRAAAVKSQSAPQITINNDYTGLATLLQPFLSAANSNTPRPVPSTPTNSRSRITASPAKPAQMTFAEFGTAFKVSDEILDCLAPLEFDGPHVLDFVENSDLDRYLTIAQRASLCWAHSEWKQGKLSL